MYGIADGLVGGIGYTRMGNIIIERTRLKSCSKYLISYILSNTLFTPVITPIVVTPVTLCYTAMMMRKDSER